MSKRLIEKTLSEQLADFLDLLKDVPASYNYMVDNMKEQDAATQDILHSYELDDLKYKERAKLSTTLGQVRKKRRAYKDGVEELEPLFKFVNDNKRFLDNLRNVLGDVRKAEKYHSGRKYYPRLLKDIDTLKE